MATNTQAEQIVQMTLELSQPYREERVINSLRRRLVEDFEKPAGRDDDPQLDGGPPGDPGLSCAVSRYREEPLQRARARPADVLGTAFGNTEAATALIERIKHIHAYLHGTRPDGVHYRAACAARRPAAGWAFGTGG